MRHVAILAAAAASAAVLAAPAAAAPTFYFGCTDGMKYQGNLAQTWSETKPAASFQAGAGCGSADLGPLQNKLADNEVDFYGGGSYTGAIQAINVELHSLLVSQARSRPDPGVVGELVIDGNVVLTSADLRITPTLSSTGLTEKYVFSFSNKKPAGATVAPPLAGDGAHKVEIRFSPRFADYQNVWVWGASEVPANAEINPAVLASPKITN